MTNTDMLFGPDKVAVITGAASGIGRAAAERMATLGMKLALFDQDAARLEAVAQALPNARALPGDVSRLEDVEALRDMALEAFGRVDIVMNNAAMGGEGSDNWSGLDAWRRIIDVNLWGVVNGTHVFAPVLLAQGTRAAIINTGSKQGITNPPGYPAYAVAKAGVRTLTEQLAHGLLQEGDDVTAHLLVPGWTFTGMTNTIDGKQPTDSWTAGQVVDLMIERVERGDFYILCPDNAVSPELDAARILWSAGDMTQGRPALSRWHPDWVESFQAFVRERAASGPADFRPGNARRGLG